MEADVVGSDIVDASAAAQNPALKHSNPLKKFKKQFNKLKHGGVSKLGLKLLRKEWRRSVIFWSKVF